MWPRAHSFHRAEVRACVETEQKDALVTELVLKGAAPKWEGKGQEEDEKKQKVKLSKRGDLGKEKGEK